MILALVFVLLPTSIFSVTCGELKPRMIKTYIPSDSTFQCNFGYNTCQTVEVRLSAWNNIPNAQWIWNTTSTDIKGGASLQFSKTFTVIGRINSGKLKILADNSVSEFFINKNPITIPSTLSHQIIEIIDITTTLQIGSNSLSFNAFNDLGSPGPAGVTLIIEIESEVLV